MNISKNAWLIVGTLIVLALIGQRQFDSPPEPDESSASDDSRFESVIKPVNLIDGAEAAVDSDVQASDERSDALSQFAHAVSVHQSGDLSSATTLYQALIASDPMLLAAYYNLAALQVEQGDVTGARATLENALQANSSTQKLNDALRLIYRNQAAHAYAQALGNDAPEIPSPTLELITDLNAEAAWLSKVDQLEQRLIVQRREFEEQLAVQEAAYRAELELQRLQGDLDLVTQASTTENELTFEIAALRNANQVLRDQLQAVLADNRAAEGDQKTNSQVEQTNTTADESAQSVITTLISPEQPVVEAEVAKPTTVVTVDASSQTQELFKKRVQSWAQAWAAQDVEAYLEHYADDYRTGSLSHADWVAQRRVRLTNKGFIKVDVSRMTVSDPSADEVSVTFTQRYRSNSFDDTIRKVLVFKTAPDIAQAPKIVREYIVSDN